MCDFIRKSDFSCFPGFAPGAQPWALVFFFIALIIWGYRTVPDYAAESFK